MCDLCDKQFSGCAASEGMPLEEAVRIAAGVRHRQDGTSRAFDVLLRELDLLRIKIDCHEKAALRQAEEIVRLNDEKRRWDKMTGRTPDYPASPSDEAGCGA